ncbi:MAG: hypothetical protein KAI83_15050 [Thiomargarita sp.]|nr:hypothetical protein [Thiomargarita sp.]
MPLLRATTRDCPYSGQPQGIAPTQGNHKGLPLLRATTRGCPMNIFVTRHKNISA